MCGIFGYIGKRQDAALQTLLGLKKLEYRGYDSWGIAVVRQNEKKIIMEKQVGKIGQATTTLPSGTVALGHTRWATHGGVTELNAHPHNDCQKTIAVVHNGIVENYQEMKNSLLSQNHLFCSETDTEVIAHLIEENQKKNTTLHEAVFTAFRQLHGSNAIAVLDNTGESLVICRNGSPVVIGIGDGEFFIASDTPAFLSFTNKVIFLHNGECVVLTRDNCTVFDLATGKEKEYCVEEIAWKPEDAERGNYPHFLQKEIFEQSETIPKVAQMNEKSILSLADKITKSKEVIFVACGTASYCALAAKYLFAQAGIKAESYGAYEFLPFASFYGKQTICFAISQSGETADTIIATRAAKESGACIVAVVNARGSTLERIADIVLPVGAGPEIAVVSTKAFTAQTATLYLLAMAALGKYAEGKKTISSLGKILQNWLGEETRKNSKALAEKIKDQKHIFVLGKYIAYPAALEVALKIKETSYLHAEAFSSGELKHGVIALIEKGTPCLVLVPNDSVKKEVLASAAEVKARGGFVIGVGPQTDPLFDDWIPTPDIQEATFFPLVMVGQLLGYYLGVARGTDPDKPRNLAKSVTVK